MKRKKRSLLGSGRGRIFREPKSGSRTFRFKRKQKVRFRPRYAGSLLRDLGKALWTLLRAGAVVGAIGGVSLFGVRAWKTSSVLRVKEIIFTGDIPARLRTAFPIKPNDNLLLIHPRRLQAEELQKYPELRALSITRMVTRAVVVTGTFRVPVARLSGQEFGVDDAGVVFPLAEIALSGPALPILAAPTDSDRKLSLEALAIWKKRAPDFYSLVKKIETDRMRRLSVDFFDEVSIDWDEPDEAHLVDRAEKVLRLRTLFEPVKKPAVLKFVTDDRIVMDKNWAKK